MMMTPPTRVSHTSYCRKNWPRKDAEAPRSTNTALNPRTNSSECTNVARRFTPA